ncbi:MAG: acetaldehyde dehydrogenase (acetylating) [Chloroflexi bacterium]|nr:acetaldehyde dehydrogenase (acetylating) [Chloroflexota bacterium]
MVSNSGKLKVGILGSGNIGTDLLVKVLHSPFLECTIFMGRNLESPGMVKAKSLGVNLSDRGIEALMQNPDCCDLVFDATSAARHIYHWPILEKLGKIAIDMTPSRVGAMIIPAVNIHNCLKYKNVNMVSCGGQASIPLAYLIGETHNDVDYIEVVSSIASRSAGPATRINIDEYIETTEEALKIYSGCKQSKTILILNPATPCVNMQTTISAKVRNPDLGKLNVVFGDMIRRLQAYVPGYQVVVPPTWENNRIVISVVIQGLGNYLPVFAGNLDIMNCAAIATAEEYARSCFSRSGKVGTRSHHA